MAATQKNRSPIPNMLIGVVLMLAGVWYANRVHENPDAIAKFAESKNVSLNIGETIATVGVLLILFPFIASFFIKPLMSAIDERNNNLEQTFADAENLRAQMVATRAEYDARLQAAESSARDQIQAQVREAQELRKTLTAEAAETADRMKEQASQEIETERTRVLGELRGRTVDLALAAAQKVVGENLDDARNRRLVDDFINDLEVVR